jgi:hypothetical protein
MRGAALDPEEVHMSDGPQFSFLPPPRIPVTLLLELPDPGWLDELHPGGGDFIRDWQGLHATVLGAIDAVTAGRPGGADWGAAMRQDADAVLAGNHPRVWATSALLKGDYDRWAYASAEARTVAVRVQALRTSAPAAALIEAARARYEAFRVPLLIESEKAYRAAVGDATRSERWAHYDAADALAADAARYAGLVAWLDGGDQRFDPEGWGAPWTSEARGFWLAAGYALRPHERPLTIPQNVTWPDDMHLPNVPVGAKGVGLREQGWAPADASEKPINRRRDAAAAVS